MVMEASILKATKKVLGLPENYTPFDQDVLMHINATLSVVHQIGVGPLEGFWIDDETAKWDDLNLPQDQLGLLRTYVFLNVRMLFDPPATSFLIEATQKQIDEHLMRLSYMREGTKLPIDSDEFEVVLDTRYSARGEQFTAVYVWIMDHDLGYNPAAFVFTTSDGLTELEPQSIEYVNNNRTLATWPTPTAGKWMAS